MSIEQQTMMAQQGDPAQQDQQDAPAPKANFSPAEEKDLRIGVLMGEQFLDEGGLDVIQKAMDSSSDPAQVIGQFFVQLIQKMQESMPSEMKLSPKIYLSKHGWLEQMMDYVIEKLHIDTAITDRAEVYVAHTAQQLAQGKQAAPGQTGPAPDGSAAQDPNAGGPPLDPSAQQPPDQGGMQ